jgi:hypothetical protein
MAHVRGKRPLMLGEQGPASKLWMYWVCYWYLRTSRGHCAADRDTVSDCR